MENPYFNRSPLNLPLQLELCQEIHWTALQNAAQGLYPQAVPACLDLAQLARARKFMGTDVYLFHPAYVGDVFAGVTLAHYQAIETLYCSRLRRSVKMTHRILTQMAEEAGQPPLPYEAIWAICLHLEEKLQRNTAIKMVRTDSTWQLVILEPQVAVAQENGRVFSAQIICIVELGSSKVLAYRIAAADRHHAARLAIYDALSAARRPAAMAPAGLVWHIPTQLYTEINLDQDVADVIQQDLQVQVQQRLGRGPFIDTLRGNWAENLAGRVLRRGHFDRAFDNYLHRLHGYGPKKVQADLAHEYGSLTGYNLDPAALFPQLCLLLPPYDAVISAEGQVSFDGLTYTDPLFKYWPGQCISLRRSEQTKHTAWIYVAGEILGEAKAENLAGAGGSCRRNRPSSDWPA